jgi:hypothetical protein
VRRLAAARTTCLLLAVAAIAAFAACTEDEERADDKEPPPPVADAPAVGDAGPIHVHALGVNPADGALFIATHTGLFREPRPGAKPERVAGRFQDTMGFTVTGADRFLASGHPDGREKLPPFLGLIESTDAGESWDEISLQGEMDFHVLEATGRRIYGFGSDWKTRTERLLVSDDRGESWRERRAPEPLMDLAVDPGDPDTTVAAGRDNLHLTRDAGRRWRTISGDPGLLAWLGRRLYLVTPGGVVHVAGDRAGRWQAVGLVGGEPAALASAGGEQLYVALHDGTIKRSTDGGRSWRAGAGAARKARSTKSAAPATDKPDPIPDSRRSAGGPDAPLSRRGQALRDLPGAREVK